MHDAVADVLAQRARLSTGRNTAVALSLLLHAGAAGLAIWSALHAPPPQRVSSVAIRLAPPAQRISQPLTPKPPAPPKPLDAPKEPEPPRIQEPKPQPAKPVTSTAPPEKNTAPPSPFGRSHKKASDNPPAPTPVPATTTTAPDIPIGGAGVTGFEGGDFHYPLYVEGMQRKIGNFWIRPQVAPGIATVIFFRIERDGRISESKIVAPSGNSTFDRAALSAVRSASPLNPLPFGYNGTYLGVQQTFR